MLVRIVDAPAERSFLDDRVREVLLDLGLSEVVPVELVNDAERDAYIQALGITRFPALCLEEETIQFRDTLFEGSVPDALELKSMFLAIVGAPEGEGCGSCSTGGCGSCSTGGCC